MNPYTSHITPYDLAFLGTVFIGLNFALLLWFTKRANRSANRFLSLALTSIVLWIARVLGTGIGLSTYRPGWCRFLVKLIPKFKTIGFLVILCNLISGGRSKVKINSTGLFY